MSVANAAAKATSDPVAASMKKWEAEQEVCTYSTIEEMDEQKVKSERCSVLYLARLNSFLRDSEAVAYDEPHVYFILGSCYLILSITTFIKWFFPVFDAEFVSKKIEKQSKHLKSVTDPEYKLFGCHSAKEIIANWENTNVMGRLLHSEIEKYKNCKSISKEWFLCDPRVQTGFYQFVKLSEHNASSWWNFEYERFRTELVVWCQALMLAGRVDMILRHKEDHRKVILIDLKRVRDMPLEGNRYTKNAYGACAHLQDTKFVRNALQLNWYKYMVEKYYDLDVIGMFVVQMHPSFGVDACARKIEMPDMQNEVRAMAKVRIQQLARIRRK